MQYMVRLRDVLDGTERWLDEPSGQHFRADNRQTADCAALAMSRLCTTELAYVVEIEPMFEIVSDA